MQFTGEAKTSHFGADAPDQKNPNIAQKDLLVVDSDRNLSVIIVHEHKSYLPIGVGNADIHPIELGWWWLARLKINKEYQSRGFGTYILKVMLDTLSKKPINGLIVAPGGYGSDEARLFRFYKARGFVDGVDGELRWHRQKTNTDS